jgi:DNA-binding NarL/FixJ family response regulator
MSNSRPISIVVADDHPVVLEGLASILRSQADLNVVATCDDGTAAAQAIREFVPDIVVLDLMMPGLDGLAVLSGITADGLPTKVIFLSAFATDAQLAAATAAGAQGILWKGVASEKLVDCIRSVAAGLQYCAVDGRAATSAPEAERGPEGAGPESGPSLERLSAREREIAILISEGLSNKEIARRLLLTEGTVKIHLHNIYGKLEVRNRAALAALTIAWRNQLVP